MVKELDPLQYLLVCLLLDEANTVKRALDSTHRHPRLVFCLKEDFTDKHLQAMTPMSVELQWMVTSGAGPRDL